MNTVFFIKFRGFYNLAYLDFDTLLICNNHFDEDSVRYAFELFKSVGIRKFIFTYDFDRDLKPMSLAVQKLRTLNRIFLH